MKPLEFEDESTLFSLAGEFLEGASILIGTPTTRVNVSLVTYYLLGHATELLLKSFLFKRGDSIEYLRLRLGHKIAELVRRARTKGLPESIPLRNALQLSMVYSGKQTEYRQKHAASFPPLDLLLDEARGLQAYVFSHVADFHTGVDTLIEQAAQRKP